MKKLIPYFAVDKPSRCPHCGCTRVVPIVRGLVGPDLEEAEQRGEVVLGGCCVSDCDPSWQCLDCSAMIFLEEQRKGFESSIWASAF